MATKLGKQHGDELVHVERLSVRSGGLHVCAECKHAQLFAVQPRAVCTCQSSASAGKVLFAGQPACADMSPREGGEQLVLSMWASGPKKTRTRFVSAPSRIQ